MAINTTLMINGRKQFFSADGTPLAGGFVYYYTPGTTSFKTTWKDSGQANANTNPIILDAAGSALVYGSGQYREYVTDSNANLIQDALTQSEGYNFVLVGTTTNDNAAAGVVGEYIAQANSGVALTTTVAAQIASISLTAGDWDVWGAISFSFGGTTTISALVGGINSTAAMPAAGLTGAYFLEQATLTTGGSEARPVGMQRFSLASTTTIYLMGQANFGVSTATGAGLIAARRVR